MNVTDPATQDLTPYESSQASLEAIGLACDRISGLLPNETTRIAEVRAERLRKISEELMDLAEALDRP